MTISSSSCRIAPPSGSCEIQGWGLIDREKGIPYAGTTVEKSRPNAVRFRIGCWFAVCPSLTEHGNTHFHEGSERSDLPYILCSSWTMQLYPMLFAFAFSSLAFQ